ncbi:MAG TPA: tetratricopeptide repeat protein [Micropepsaceae bacterium]|nr:tetratricopeptide repeat protein [Micropepsaceae bacterium]
MSSAAGAAEKPAAGSDNGDANEMALEEPQFLKAAEQAAKDGDADGAVQLYQSALIYAPGDPVPYERLAEFYVHNAQPELALRYFSLALDAQPAYAPALRGLALLDIAAGNRAGAQAQHEILIHSCGAKCPETAQVEKALNTANSP